MSFGRVLITGVLTVGLSGTPSHASGTGPEFVATAPRPSYPLGTPVLVKLSLTNDALPARYEAPFFVVIPRLTFGRQLPNWPYLHVAFDVTGPDGQPVVPTALDASLLAEPQITQFGELHAGSFFGTTIDLGAEWYGFSFRTVGKYVVRATLSTGARRWLDAWLERHHKDRADLPFSYDHVWAETLAAAPIEIVITK